MWPFKRLLVPVDFSPESELALDWAIRMTPIELGASIILCYVRHRETPTLGPDAMMFQTLVISRQEKRGLELKLKKLQTRIPEGIRSSVILLEGPTAVEIARTCQKETIELVVLTTHGRRGLSHWLHGSVSEEVVRLAPCPVLVLHMNVTVPSALAG